MIKILWSRHYDPAAAIGPTDLPGSAGRHTIGPIPLLILACLYIPMACLLASSIVPTGLIVPVLLIGGTVGRLLGLFAQFILPHANDSADADCDGIPWYVKVFTPHAAQGCVVAWNWVDPGAFAIYGSAAFFGGISRLHLTIPVIFMEITGQVRMLLPIMLACKVGSLVADYLHPHSLFHAIIELKGLTFLAGGQAWGANPRPRLPPSPLVLAFASPLLQTPCLCSLTSLWLEPRAEKLRRLPTVSTSSIARWSLRL